MAYTVNLTDGTTFAIVEDGTTNNSSSMTLVGKNTPNYGEILDENYIQLLECGANTTEPSAPIDGQLWFDKTAGVLKVYSATATEFKNLGAVTTQTTEPASPVLGDMWFNSDTNQLYVYDGTTFAPVGGESTTVSDGATDHPVVKHYVDGVLVAITSTVALFAPNPALSGFLFIRPGYNLSTDVANARFAGIATNADQADNAIMLAAVPATDYLRSDIDDSTTGTFDVVNDGGITIGAGGDLTIGANVNGATFVSNLSNGDINFNVNDGGVPTDVLTIDGATARARVLDAPINVLDIANKAYADTKLPLDGSLPMTGDLDMLGNSITWTDIEINGVDNITQGHIELGATASDDGTINAGDTLYLIADRTGTSGGAKGIYFSTGAPSQAGGATGLLNIRSDGLVTQEIIPATYESLVISVGDDAIPNKLYVDNKIIGSYVFDDVPDAVGLTMHTNATSGWQTYTVHADAKYAILSAYVYGIFDSGGGFVHAAARRKGNTSVSPAYFGTAVAICGHSTNGGGYNADSVTAGSMVECDSQGRIEVYGFSSSTGTIAPQAVVYVKGYIK